jgi:hypothetical protein
MKGIRLWRALFAPVLLASAFAVGAAHSGVAHAETDTWNHDANCNNWHPHSWSQYIWSGSPSNTLVFAEAQLWKWNYSTGSYQLDKDSQPMPQYGSSGSIDADAYESANEYGTGNWQSVNSYNELYGQSQGPHATVYKYPNCG